MGVPTTMTLRDGKAAECEAVIARFRRTYRRRLRRLATRNERLGDLITSFPAAAFAIATEFGARGHRHRATDLAIEGASLKAIAKACRVPFWMRKLPPEAFIALLPDDLPANEAFGQRVIGQMPDDVADVGGWLQGVLAAERVAGEAVAEWVAKIPGVGRGGANTAPVELLALFAWVSVEKPAMAAKLLPGRWNDRMSIGRAADLTLDWVTAIQSELVMGDAGLRDTWLAGGRAAGYRFVPITTLSELQAEAKAMDNCVASYAPQLIAGQCRLFGIRRGARRIATLEVRPHPYHDGIPSIVQLLASENCEAPQHVWAAAFTWLGKQGRYELPGENDGAASSVDLSTWQQLWRPYWRQKGSFALIPEQAGPQTISNLVRAAHDLSRRANR
ncbi:MAG: PcfJ domain-containing protein [Pseudomonadota bacterium]